MTPGRSSGPLSVSVVIPAYNLARYLPQAIDSALAQTLPAAEVVVVDDGSWDETPRVLASFGGRIRAIRQENRGLSAARNAGVAGASGDLIAFLDADDVWHPQKLEKQVSRFATDAALGLVHCGLEEIDGAGKVIGRRLDGLEGWVAEEMLLFERGVILGGGSGAMISRSVFEEVGGCDLRLSTSADWDLHYRIARVRRVGFVAEPLLRYRFHGANMHANIGAMEHDMRIAYRGAFERGGAALRGMRRRCYGNLYAVLAGSYFRYGQTRRFLCAAAKALWFRPTTLPRFLGYPLRRRRKAASTSSIARAEAVPNGVAEAPRGGS
jgi:glycosyltransferase involved in cell wall biosynthesis